MRKSRFEERLDAAINRIAREEGYINDSMTAREIELAIERFIDDKIQELEQAPPNGKLERKAR